MSTKRCTGSCGRDLPLDAFPKDRGTARPRCRGCFNAARRAVPTTIAEVIESADHTATGAGKWPSVLAFDATPEVNPREAARLQREQEKLEEEERSREQRLNSDFMAIRPE